MLDKWKKTGVRVGVVAKSTSRADERSSSTLHGALHGLIAPSYAPALQRNVKQDSEEANFQDEKFSLRRQTNPLLS